MKILKTIYGKTKPKYLVAATLLLGSSVTFAQESAHLAAGVYQIKEADKFRLIVEKQSESFASVQLLTKDGAELYAGHISKKTIRFRQNFDVRNLEDGRYILRIKQGNDIILRSLQLGRNSPTKVSISEPVLVVLN